MIDLEAIRARVEARRLSAPSRRRLRPEERDCDKLLAYVDKLREAARKVTCRRCLGHGNLLQPDAVPPGWRTDPCPDCADLRRLLGDGSHG